MTHVKKTMKSEVAKKAAMGKKWFTHVLKTAKRTYKKHGGGESDIGAKAAPVTGGRRKTVRRRRA